MNDGYKQITTRLTAKFNPMNNRWVNEKQNTFLVNEHLTRKDNVSFIMIMSLHMRYI